MFYDYIAITGSASLSYPPFLGQQGGASNAFKPVPKKQPGPATRHQTRVCSPGLTRVQPGPKPQALFLNKYASFI